MITNFHIEQEYLKKYGQDEKKIEHIIGIDEAGRGSLCGPVVAAAVLATTDMITQNKAYVSGIDDSKKITRSKRESIFQEIANNYIYTIGIVGPNEIDQINILQATKKACLMAISDLYASYKNRPFSKPIYNVENKFQEKSNIEEAHGLILIDGNMNFDQKHIISVIKGDQKSILIAAASIIAKVTRDNIMHQLSFDYPGYGWEQNCGYGTTKHIQALKELGVTSNHRTSFLRRLI